VAIDKDGNRQKVPGLQPETANEIRRYGDALRRREHREAEAARRKKAKAATTAQAIIPSQFSVSSAAFIAKMLSSISGAQRSRRICGCLCTVSITTTMGAQVWIFQTWKARTKSRTLSDVIMPVLFNCRHLHPTFPSHRLPHDETWKSSTFLASRTAS